MTSRRGLLAVLVVAAAVRIVPAVLSARLTTDVLRYHKVATHVLERSWNPYQAPGLYPYPPLWIWFETGAEALARATGWAFPVLIKLPVVAADVGIVALLYLVAGGRPAWSYALHPASVLVTAFHGQFDSLLLLFLLLAVAARERGRLDAAGWSLAGAIATKSFPVLLVPLFIRELAPRAAWRLALLATVPVGLALLPFAWHDFGAVRRELLGYGGVADFGWIGAYRGLLFLSTGRLARSEALHWATPVLAAKILFLVACMALGAALWRRRLSLPLRDAVLATILGFVVLYGALSAQYLLWPVALGALRPDRWFAAYGAAATLALLAFYSFFHPSVLFADGLARGSAEAWVIGVIAVLVVSAAWLGSLLHRAREDP